MARRPQASGWRSRRLRVVPRLATPRLATALGVALLAIGLIAGSLPAAGLPAQTTPDAVTIESEQAAVVSLSYKAPLLSDTFAVDDFIAATSQDQLALRDATAAASSAYAAQSAAGRRLASDRAALASAGEAEQAADSALAADRARLGSLAVGAYIGDLTDPLSPGATLAAAEAQAVDEGEVDVVAGIVDGHLARDQAAAGSAAALRRALTATVGADSGRLATRQRVLAAATGVVARASSTLNGDQAQLALARDRLGAEQASLSAALADVRPAPGTPQGSLGLLGGAALDAQELVAWFDAQGYVDLTSAPIDQLAQWYVAAGQAEGIRGDVAFAQAVLETGGFSSPDAVDLSNFAGIGHCDSCATGWAFPSPHGGVVGHVELLRIFADREPAPAGAPAPVLAALTPQHQFEAGCCSTVEALTGVWATDPTYGSQILAIYKSMLDYTLGGAPS